MTTYTDQINGVGGDPSASDSITGGGQGLAFKAPVRAATTANITLSGTQTIDGVAVVAQDRVLVKDQTNAVDNGIWIVSSGAWSRATDMDSNRDVVKGTRVAVTNGTANATTSWQVTAENTIAVGTDDITFSAVGSSEIAATLNATNKASPVDADRVFGSDSAASFGLVYYTWTQVKAFLKTYFDTLYQPLLATLTSWGAITRASGVDTFIASPTWTNFLSMVTGEPTFYTPGGTDVALADGGTGASLADPNADRIMFWDDSAGAVTWLVPGTGIAISGTSLDLDADLQSWAGVTRASGFDTFAATPSSANLRGLLTDETGTGSAVFATSPAITTPALTDPVITGAITEDVYTITDGAGFVINPRNGSIQEITLGASRTPTVSGWVSGDSVYLKIADGTAYTITWTTIGVVWIGGSAPTLATTGWTHVVLWRVGSVYYGQRIGDSA